MFIDGVLDGDEADNQERAKNGIAAPDFGPIIIVRDDGSRVVSEALKSFMSADKSLRDVSHCQGCLSGPHVGHMIYATLPKSKHYFSFRSSS